MSSIINILLCGGLGNQLFQYAFGRALAERYGAKLQIDVSTGFAMDRVYKRNYELDVFQLKNTVHLIEPNLFDTRVEQIKLRLARREIFFRKSYLIELSNSYDESYKNLSLSNLIKTYGCWQDIRYFLDIEDLLRIELRFARKLSPANQLKAQEMQATESVAIHIRRAQYYWKMSMDHYAHAISQMLERVPNAKLYCFSDDLDWCRDNLESKYNIELIDNRNLPATEDFQLMTNCKHYITADSSFSWWAAWIGGKQGQVIAPVSKGCKAYESAEKSPQHWQFINYSK